jgi:hypothetical protein
LGLGLGWLGKWEGCTDTRCAAQVMAWYCGKEEGREGGTEGQGREPLPS